MNYDIPGTTSKQVEKPRRQKVIFGFNRGPQTTLIMMFYSWVVWP